MRSFERFARVTAAAVSVLVLGACNLGAAPCTVIRLPQLLGSFTTG